MHAFRGPYTIGWHVDPTRHLLGLEQIVAERSFESQRHTRTGFACTHDGDPLDGEQVELLVTDP